MIVCFLFVFLSIIEYAFTQVKNYIYYIVGVRLDKIVATHKNVVAAKCSHAFVGDIWTNNAVVTFA